MKARVKRYSFEGGAFEAVISESFHVILGSKVGFGLQSQ